MPVQTRRQLATNPKMCMFALTDELSSVFPDYKSQDLVDKPFGKMIIKAKVVYGRQEGMRSNCNIATKHDCSIKVMHREGVYVAQPEGVHSDPRYQKKILASEESFVSIKKALDPGDDFQLPAKSKGHFQTLIMAGCIDTRKKHLLRIQFLDDKLVSWMSKKQKLLAMSSPELSHSRTKHSNSVSFQNKEYVEKWYFKLYFVRTEYQLADMFTKALPEDRFKYLVRRIGMRCLTPADLEVLTNETA
ncbi:hypothetical protein Tco_1310211 [Tanacetum coccineum]